MGLAKEGYADANTGVAVVPCYVDSDGTVATSAINIAGTKNISIKGAAAGNSKDRNEAVLQKFVGIVGGTIQSGQSGMSVKWGRT